MKNMNILKYLYLSCLLELSDKYITLLHFVIDTYVQIFSILNNIIVK